MTGTDFDNLVSRYSRKGVLLDSNLLLLYFVGSYDPERIGSFKRTYSQGYTVDDFELLCRLLGLFGTIVTTPNIVTEVGSLSNQLRGDEKPIYYAVFAKFISAMAEYYTESRQICALEQFRHFGLTDSGIINLARGNYLVLTDDGRLVGYLQNVGIDVINFNHLRSLAM